MTKPLGFFRSTLRVAFVAAAAALNSAAKADDRAIPPAPLPPGDHPASATNPVHLANETITQKISRLKNEVSKLFFDIVKLDGSRSHDNVTKLKKTLTELKTTTAKLDVQDCIPVNVSSFRQSSCLSTIDFEGEVVRLNQIITTQQDHESLILVLKAYEKALRQNRNERLYRYCFNLEQEKVSDDFKYLYEGFSNQVSKVALGYLAPLIEIDNHTEENSIKAKQILRILEQLTFIEPNHDPGLSNSNTGHKIFNFDDPIENEHAASVTNYFPELSNNLKKDFLKAINLINIPIHGKPDEIKNFALFCDFVFDHLEPIYGSSSEYYASRSALISRIGHKIKEEMVRALTSQSEYRKESLKEIENFTQSLDSHSRRISNLVHGNSSTTGQLYRLLSDSISTSTDHHNIYYAVLKTECLGNPDNSNSELYEQAINDIKSIVDGSANQNSIKPLKEFLAYSLLVNHNQNRKGVQEFLNEFSPGYLRQNKTLGPQNENIFLPLKFLLNIALDPSIIVLSSNNNPTPPSFKIDRDKDIKEQIQANNDKYLRALELFESVVNEAQMMLKKQTICEQEINELNDVEPYLNREFPLGLQLANKRLEDSLNLVRKILKNSSESIMFSEINHYIDPYTLGKIIGYSIDFDPKSKIEPGEEKPDECSLFGCRKPVIISSTELINMNTGRNLFAGTRPLYLNPYFPTRFPNIENPKTVSALNFPKVQRDFLLGLTSAETNSLSLNQGKNRLERLRIFAQFLESNHSESPAVKGFNHGLINFIKENHEFLINTISDQSSKVPEQQQPLH